MPQTTHGPVSLQDRPTSSAENLDISSADFLELTASQEICLNSALEHVMAVDQVGEPSEQVRPGVEQNSFVLNPSPSNFAPVGAFNRNEFVQNSSHYMGAPSYYFSNSTVNIHHHYS